MGPPTRAERQPERDFSGERRHHFQPRRAGKLTLLHDFTSSHIFRRDLQWRRSFRIGTTGADFPILHNLCAAAQCADGQQPNGLIQGKRGSLRNDICWRDGFQFLPGHRLWHSVSLRPGHEIVHLGARVRPRAGRCVAPWIDTGFRWELLRSRLRRINGSRMLRWLGARISLSRYASGAVHRIDHVSRPSLDWIGGKHWRDTLWNRFGIVRFGVVPGQFGR
jgi:hypothetical protein